MDFNVCCKISELMHKHTAHQYTRGWRKCLERPRHRQLLTRRRDFREILHRTFNGSLLTHSRKIYRSIILLWLCMVVKLGL